MFYIIGLGLGDYKDITVKGLEIVKQCEKVYLEAYTSILTCGTEKLVQTFKPRYHFLVKIETEAFRKPFTTRN